MGGQLQSEVQIHTIVPFSNLKRYQILSHPNVHVDSFGTLNINGRTIKLAIEHQGQQHNPDPSIGFEAYKRLTRGERTYNDWLNYIERDRAKVNLFNDLRSQDYYLIVVPWDIVPEDRFAFIRKEFIRLTNIKI